MAVPPVSIGDVIAGKYIVERVIGEGGMGVVLAARHRELEQRVAIKFLLPEIAEQGMAAERFRREARAAARMRGEHVCRVLDVGTLESGVPYMVMEYLEGWDLASELDRRGSLPPSEAISYVLEACEALAEAHAGGVIHRDLKPANLFLESRADGSRRVKVLDFGVSKSLLDVGSGQGALTKTSSLVGSPLYMSPEQLDSARDVDARTDVWALGVVLYELIAGHTPFSGETMPQLVAAVLHDQPKRLSDLRTGIPPGLDGVVARTLEKHRPARYSTVAELAQALLPFAPADAGGSARRISRLLEPNTAARVPLHSRMPVTVASTISDGASGTPLSWDQQPKGGAAKRRWGAIGLLLAIVCAISLWALQRSKSANAGDEEADTASEHPAASPDTGRTGAPAERAAAVRAPASAAPPPAADALQPAAAAGAAVQVETLQPAAAANAPKVNQPPGAAVADPAAERDRATEVSTTPRANPVRAAQPPTAAPLAAPNPSHRAPVESDSSRAPKAAGRSLSDFGGRR